MKTLIISDVHSNIIALEEVWKHENDADMIVSAGDVVGCGAWPKECIDWFIEHKVINVIGNHDESVLKHSSRPPHPDPNWDMYNGILLEQRHIDYLHSLPISQNIKIDGKEFGIRHKYDGYEILRSRHDLYRFYRECFGVDGSRLIFGHTHRRELHYFLDDVFWMNPGSVSYKHGEPKDGMAEYAVMIDGKISLKEIPFNPEPIYEAADKSNMCEQSKRESRIWW